MVDAGQIFRCSLVVLKNIAGLLSETCWFWFSPHICLPLPIPLSPLSLSCLFYWKRSSLGIFPGLILIVIAVLVILYPEKESWLPHKFIEARLLQLFLTLPQSFLHSPLKGEHTHIFDHFSIKRSNAKGVQFHKKTKSINLSPRDKRHYWEFRKYWLQLDSN